MNWVVFPFAVLPGIDAAGPSWESTQGHSTDEEEG